MNSLNNILKIRNFTHEKDIFTTLFYDYNINNHIEISGFLDKDINLIIKSGNSIVYDGLNNWLSSININYEYFLESFSYSASIDNDSNIHINLPTSNNTINLSAEYLASFSSYDTLKNNLSKVLMNNNTKKLLNKYLHDFDNNIEDIMFIGNIISVSLKNLSNAVNIKSMGKGFYSYLTIISSILAGNKIIIIDEFENGIHFTLLDKLIDNILNISLEYNIQFFISTHSKEFLELLSKKIHNNSSNIKLFNIYQKESNIHYITYNKEDIALNIHNQNEIRD